MHPNSVRIETVKYKLGIEPCLSKVFIFLVAVVESGIMADRRGSYGQPIVTGKRSALHTVSRCLLSTIRAREGDKLGGELG